jgi:hypothetical protein
MKKFLDKFEEYSKIVEWRKGQAYFNALHEVHPELADEIRGGNLDPFYQDKRIDEFLAWVKTRLT